MPLTDAELADLRQRLKRETFNDIWFVLVRFNKDGRYEATAYSSPAGVGVVRHGRQMRLSNQISIETLDAVLKQLNASTQTFTPPSYRYLVPTDANGAATRVPSEADVPFDCSDQISDEDLLAIIKLARSADVASRTFANPKDPQRILSIEAANDGTVTVEIGAVVGPLYGGGSGVVLERRGKDFAIKSTFIWVS